MLRCLFSWFGVVFGRESASPGPARPDERRRQEAGWQPDPPRKLLLMQLGLFLPTASPIANPEWLLSIASEVEARGVTTVWIPEHVVQFDEYESRYPYSPDGKIPVPSTSGMLDPTTTLAFLAAATKTVR